MKSIRLSTLLTLAIFVFGTLVSSGCNTMRGLGQDTEKAGEKIQEKASR